MCMSTLKAACDVTDGAFKVKLNETHVAIYTISGNSAQGHSGESQTRVALLKCAIFVEYFLFVQREKEGPKHNRTATFKVASSLL